MSGSCLLNGTHILKRIRFSRGLHAGTVSQRWWPPADESSAQATYLAVCQDALQRKNRKRAVHFWTQMDRDWLGCVCRVLQCQAPKAGCFRGHNARRWDHTLAGLITLTQARLAMSKLECRNKEIASQFRAAGPFVWLKCLCQLAKCSCRRYGTRTHVRQLVASSASNRQALKGCRTTGSGMRYSSICCY
jgi:hypothetical protein